MDGLVRSMARKRERHFNESKTVLSVAMMLFGVCACFCLVMMWPQVYMINMFNSKLAYHLILDVEDYFTCDKEYIKFVVDEPDDSYSMFTVFIFNVTNAADVLQRGNKPEMLETGPYGFVKYTYKYDISFDDPEESTTVTFKEYSILQTIVDDPDACERMYFRMDRDNLEAEPCFGNKCKCKDYDSLITIVNPLLLKMMHDETPSEIIAQHSVEIFSEIQRVLEDPFTEAVRAHLVGRALKEIYQFRIQMQAGFLVRDGINSLLLTNSLADIADVNIQATACDMAKYGITGCPFNPYNTIASAKLGDIPSTNYPSIQPLLNASLSLSVMNLTYGFPRMLGAGKSLGMIDFNGLFGYSAATDIELAQFAEDYTHLLATTAFGSNYTTNQRLGSRRMLVAFCSFLSANYIRGLTSTLTSMAYTEFLTAYEQVPCDPFGTNCIWQFGYMRHLYNLPAQVSLSLAQQLIDLTTETSTNPANLYKDINAPKWYNAWKYCTDVRNYNSTYDISCTNLEYTYTDGLISQPAALWGKDNGLVTDNLTALHSSYRRLSTTVKDHYFHLSCNISGLIQDVYRTSTGFHDNFVVRFLNKYKDPSFTHNFTVGNWNDMGIAQWGGGFVTYALVEVRSIYMLVRDGMWRIGADNYFTNFMEYSSWATRQGYPQAWIYSVDDARTLLHALARRDDVGVALRRHIAYQGTTFIGDGVNIIRSVGAIGDKTFTTEANLNRFACNGSNAEPCALLDVFYDSSYAQCQVISQLYSHCEDRFNLDNIKWIVFDRCKGFETSMTSSTQAILCDAAAVYNQPHPYTKSAGNIIFRMLWASTVDLELLDGLWCSSRATCRFLDGGMFSTTTARKLLFQGYTEPSVLKFLNLKHYHDDIGFECEQDPYDMCGKREHKCTSPGVVMTLPNGDRKLLRYDNTSNEEYFAPYFVVTEESELLWPFAVDSAVAQYGQEKMLLVNYTRVRNPHFAVYPAWTANDTAFNKHYQCQKRFMGGQPDQFNSCFDKLYTGRDLLNKTLNIVAIHGNTSIYPFANASLSYDVSGSSINNQLAPELWTGFQVYPYNYLGLSGGVNYNKMEAPTVFHKLHSMPFTLYQKSLIFAFQRQLSITMPLKTTQVNDHSPIQTLPARRFVEDADTWKQHQQLGVPYDSYGMPYVIPVGTASLERYANFPVYTSTPHMYGNKEWGGQEYSLVTGTTQKKEAQRTFVDYDPVTGRALRNAIRQQINIRLEAGPMFPNAFTSQQRCILPTRIFVASSGYGCFTYIPLLWYEEARTVDTETFFRFYDHYYTRPVRAATLTSAGIAFGVVMITFGGCLYINEAYHRRRFKSRVYVD